jgi:hypothetical protein
MIENPTRWNAKEGKTINQGKHVMEHETLQSTKQTNATVSWNSVMVDGSSSSEWHSEWHSERHGAPWLGGNGSGMDRQRPMVKTMAP